MRIPLTLADLLRVICVCQCVCAVRCENSKLLFYCKSIAFDCVHSFGLKLSIFCLFVFDEQFDVILWLIGRCPVNGHKPERVIIRHTACANVGPNKLFLTCQHQSRLINCWTSKIRSHSKNNTPSCI